MGHFLSRRVAPGSTAVNCSHLGHSECERSGQGAAADAQDRLRGGLPQAAHEPAGGRTPGLSIPAVEPGDRAARASVVRGHHLPSAATGIPARGGGDGLIQPGGAELEVAELAEHGFLPAGGRGGAGTVRSAGDLPQRPGLPVHVAAVRGLLGGSLRAGFDGRPGPPDRQRVHRTAVAVAKVRGRALAGVGGRVLCPR